MTATRVCYLLHRETQKRIYLPHNNRKLLGRNSETEIQDLFVSKEQLECTADYEKCLVHIKPMGKSILGIDGYATINNKTYSIGHGHILELRLGYHQYEVVFDPLPDQANSTSTKDFPIFNLKNKTKVRENSDQGTWELIGNKELLIFTSESMQSRSKIAAFDVDGTIIKTKSGKRFPVNADDWELNLPVIKSTLEKLYNDDYKIVFFTNQSGVGKDSLKIKDFKRKVENILKALSVPVQVYAALGKGFYRKPLTGMWNTLTDIKNDDVEIDIKNSFYVGDAAGREDSWAPKKKKDHSIADRLFAINIGLLFYTPEEYFLKMKPVPFMMPEFDPRNLPTNKYPDVTYENQNVIIMVGGPGSGKSNFCTKILIPNGYEYVNRDQLGTWQKCVKALETALMQKKNCVVDNTNIDKESRSKFIDVCKRYKVECRCFLMDISSVHSKHNNKFRELTDKSHEPVSDIIINSMKKNFQEPSLSEGFEEIVKVPFVPQFNDIEKEKLYKMFLLEK